jgi:integrase
MRHSFGSYHLAHFKSASETARQMGNSEDIVYQNYYDRISEADAKAFWEG